MGVLPLTKTLVRKKKALDKVYSLFLKVRVGQLVGAAEPAECGALDTGLWCGVFVRLGV